MRSREIETVSVLSTEVGLAFVNVCACVIEGLVSIGTLARESPISVNTAPSAARIVTEGVALKHWQLERNASMPFYSLSNYLVNIQTDSFVLIIPLLTLAAVSPVAVCADSIDARVSDQTLVQVKTF